MPKILGADEYEKVSSFGTLESDEYRCKILSWEEHTQPLNQYNDDPDAKSIWFKLEPMYYEADPGAELVDKDSGEPINPDKTLIFFFDPKRTGMVPVIAKSRKFLAAALNVPIEERIEFDSWEDLYNRLVGKEIICSVIVNKKGNNAIDAVRPVRQRKQKATALEAAKEVFPDAEVTEEDTDY